ncbi:hypothetical protein ABZX75_31065 [Streptomyces sp. NPDC003038]|uniref:hypothetical protein n=1 Tax=unclassified Streptomyces TaxID=2593676 RepID=UPI0033AD0278
MVAGLVALPALGDHGDSPPPAHALTDGGITKDRDGTITVGWPQPDELPELVRKLQALGVSAALVEQKPPSECTHVGGYRNPQVLPGTGSRDFEADVVRGRGDAMVLKINSKTVPPGYTLVLLKPARPWSRYAEVEVGVKETSKVTPCEIDFSPSDEERARTQAEIEELRERQGTGSQPPASPPGTPSR